jgi:uncharacterized protein (TIGR02145 family)
MKRLMIILPLAGLIGLLSCTDFERNNPWDSKSKNWNHGYWTLTIVKNGDCGSVSLPVGENYYDEEKFVTVRASIDGNENCTFTDWSSASSSKDNSVTILMDTNKTLTANFTLDKDEPEPTCPPTQQGCPGYVPPTPTACVVNFKSKKIGTQTWMAENLNCDVEGSKCYDNDSANCTKYGRLYNWEAAMKACPTGWHLPSDAEWTALTDAVGGSSTAGTKLKATSGWNNYNGKSGNGTDDYGFAALPGGGGGAGGNFYYAGNYGCWWSSAEYYADARIAWGQYMYYDYENVYRGYDIKLDLFSVRCVQD